jgi:hypothetical protein
MEREQSPISQEREGAFLFSNAKDNKIDKPLAFRRRMNEQM